MRGLRGIPRRAAIGPLLTAAAAALLGVPAPAAEPSPAKVDFARQIRPILAENCFECHGPDPRGRKGKLRVDNREGLFANRGGYAVVVPNRPEESELIRRITAEPADGWSPPARLAAEPDEATGRVGRSRWVAEGAAWSEHWAFSPPVRPVVPASGHSGWCKNPIDAFIQARLAQAGQEPSPEADRITLIRRLSLDLLGLPSSDTPEEVDRFRPGAGRSDAHGAGSSIACWHRRTFGGKARPWLDLVRYADSDGYEDDRLRPDAWRYRDGVISAGIDMPFDQFTTEQIAGDLLPAATTNSEERSRVHRMLSRIVRRSDGRTRRSSRTKTSRTEPTPRPPSGWGWTRPRRVPHAQVRPDPCAATTTASPRSSTTRRHRGHRATPVSVRAGQRACH